MADMYVEIVAGARRFVDKCAMNKATELALNESIRQAKLFGKFGIHSPRSPKTCATAFDMLTQ